MFEQILVDHAVRPMQPGNVGLLISAITGPPTLFWAAVTGDFMPVFSGACMGVAGLGWWIYSQPQKRAVEELVKIQIMHQEAEEKAAAERLKLRLENEQLRVQLIRLTSEVKNVGLNVGNLVKSSGGSKEFPTFNMESDELTPPKPAEK
jgi:hypothetical protein